MPRHPEAAVDKKKAIDDHLPIGVVRVGRCSVDRLDTVLGIVGVVIGTVVEQVSGSVVAKTIHAVVGYAVVLGTSESVVRLWPRACRDCLGPTITVSVIAVAKSLSGRAIRAKP